MSQAQSPEDYQRHLQDAVNALHLSSAAFDRGFVGEAKRLATAIRVLVHDTNASVSLLQQMGLKQTTRYYATPSPYAAGNVLTECHLVLARITGGTMRYVPVLDDFPPVFSWRELSFEEWWQEHVVRDQQQRELSRRELVLALANKDGGAHVDPKLTSVYADLSRNNSLAWQIVSGDAATDPDDGPQFACVRQIAHELEKSIRRHLGVSALVLS